MNSLTIANVKVTPVTLADLHEYIATTIKSRQRVPIFNVNAHAINLSQRDAELREILNQAPVVFCDGVGVQLAARLLRKSIPERFTPPDWIDSLAQSCANHGWRMFFLGAADGVAEKAADVLTNRYPSLVIASHHGYFNKTGDENVRVYNFINQFEPQVLVVGFGMPIQEKWIADNIDHLNVNVILSAGALFDYISGNVVRGPRWLTDNGFEWLARLVIEPRRLWRRYVLGNPYFLFLVLRQWLCEGS